MATIKTLRGEVTKKVGDIANSHILMNNISRIHRAKILVNRGTWPGESANGTKVRAIYSEALNNHYTNTNSIAQKNQTWASIKVHPNAKEILEAKAKNFSKRDRQDMDKGSRNEIYIINTNLSPARKVTIQNRPNEISIDANPSWNSIKSFGRNNAFQIYTGSEDVVTFDVTWYATNETRKDVLAKCRLLESWTKADGYKSSPPILNLLWGNSDLFSNQEFILINASYKLSGFHDRTRGADNRIYDHGYLPTVATQTLTFKRVSSENLTHTDVVSEEFLYGINGIN